MILGLALGGVYALMASGLTMIYAVTRHINIAHGDFLTLVMYVSFTLFKTFEIDPYLSTVITVPLMFGLGLMAFRFLLRPMLRSSPLTVFMMFFGVTLVIQNTLNIVFKAQALSVSTFIDRADIPVGPIVLTAPQLVAFFVSIVTAISFYWVIRSTEFGRNVRATAQDADMASLMGVNVKRTQMFVFALGFVLLGVAGPLHSPMVSLQPFIGLDFTLKAVVILMLGGMGNFLGALIGAFIIGVAEAVSATVWSSQMASAIPFALFIVLLKLRPQGLFGRR